MTLVLNGREVADDIETELKARVVKLRNSAIRPTLAIFLVGSASEQVVYGRMIERGCKRVLVDARKVVLDESITFDAARDALERLNRDPSIHGILIKRPLPGALSDERLLQVISPDKDVDGCHFQNLGGLMNGGIADAPKPCTPSGVLELLERTGHTTSGKHVVILGRSNTVGKPLANLLSQKNPRGDATVTICHRQTRDFRPFTKMADIIVTAIGVPRFLGRDDISENAVVIDVGTNVIEDPRARKGYKLVGDADYEALMGYCRAITPVPGGIGPVTVAVLMRSVVACAEKLGAGS